MKPKVKREVPVHVQTILLPSELEKLKKVTGAPQTKEALRVAVEYYIENYKIEKSESELEVEESTNE